ncbi:MAG TPA: DNA polymerase III subunit delta [Candidatus Obscuribacterales bacterium]
MPVIVVSGEEEFEVARRVAELKQKLLDPAWAQINFVRLESPSLVDVIDAAHSLPFGAGNKVILIERCDFFTKRRAAKGGDGEGAEKVSASTKEKQIAELSQALSVVAKETYLIFACPYNFDSTLKLSKSVEKHATIETFAKERFYLGESNSRLATWCRKEAHRYNVTIDDDAIQYLLDSFEADLRSVAQEIKKAATFILPRERITLADVVEMSPQHSHVFVLAEQWITGNTASALKSLKELLSRQSGLPVIATLQTMLGKWVYMKALCESFNSALPHAPGVTRRELPFPELVRKVAQHMNQKYTLVVEKDLRRIRSQSLESLVKKRTELTRLENLVKTGQMPEAHALEALILLK